MKSKIKPAIKKQDAVTFELLHQPEFKRTILLLYMHVPANYIVRFKNKITSFLKIEEECAASDELISEISKSRQQGAPKEKLEEIKKKHIAIWEADHPEKEPHLSSTFNFCIYDSPGTGAHLQDFKFLLPHADHDVKVSIKKHAKPLPQLEEEFNALKEVLKDFRLR
ncbi:MAG: hypothetical protein R2750_11940 [Bacteroidales bacterium]